MPDSPARTCPKCATAIPASFPEGLCPKCMLEQAAPDAPPVAGTQLPTLADLDTSENTIPVAPPVSGSSPVRQMGVPSLELLRGLFPDLEILDVLGAGGMGAVYKARQPRLHRLVALKIMVCPPGYEAAFALRFEREAQVLARLNHPHIVILYDFGELGADRTGADPLYYFLMEYVDGTDLGVLIKSKELKAAQALAIVPQICEALQYAHDQGITHRDIKPANILIDKKGTVKIADFGLAKMVTGTEEALMTGLTQTGTAMGTPHYMAPEQWEHPESVDHRADIYALGVVLYEMLTGERPAGVFEPPSKKSTPPVDKKLDSVVMRAMDKNPDRRYQQAGQIGDDVTRISGANKRKPATTHGVPETTRGPLKSLLAVGVAAALAVGGWMLWQGEPTAAVTSKTVPGGSSVQPKAPGPHQAAWVPMYRQAADLAPLFSNPQALYLAFQSHPTLVQDPASGLKLADGWLTPTPTTDVKLPLPSARNAGVRMRVQMSEPTHTASIWLRGVDRGAVYAGSWRGINRYFSTASKAAEFLAERKNLVAKKPGETFTLEFYAIGQDLIYRCDGDVIRIREPGADPAIGTLNHLMIRNPVTDIEFINLDGLSEAEALKLAGVDAQPSIAATPPAQKSSVLPAGKWAPLINSLGDLPERVRSNFAPSEDGRWIIPKGGQYFRMPDLQGRDWGMKAVFSREGKKYSHLLLRLQGSQGAADDYRLGLVEASGVTQVAHGRQQGFADKKTSRGLLSKNPPAPIPEGEEYTLEFYAIGSKLIGKLNGKLLHQVEDETLHEGTVGMYVGEAFRDVEVIHLDGLSEAEALKLAGVGSAVPSPKALGGPSALPGATTATKDAPFVNTLGMKFVPVPITGGPTDGKRVLFSVWETRVRDYAAFRQALGQDWKPNSEVEQGPDHAVAHLRWDEAASFCTWLTEHERKAGRIGVGEAYRLPSDHEWSCAAGIGDREDPARTPKEKDDGIADVFPWGAGWPPPDTAGNYWSEELRPLLAAGKMSWIKGELNGRRDGFATVAPVGSYAPSAHGLYDLGGNVTEWCEEWADTVKDKRVHRGRSWGVFTKSDMLASSRGGLNPTYLQVETGFRCVLAASSAPSQDSAVVPPSAAVPPHTALGGPSTATKDAPFVNSLGMKFVPVPITGGPTGGKRVLFSIWETRVQDFKTFAREATLSFGTDRSAVGPGPTHPVVTVTWDEAQAFCAWLTESERKAGKLGAGERYRLPSDHEWSCAVGIGEREDAALSPKEKSSKLLDVHPWGTAWPPPEQAGNFASEELRPLLAEGKHDYIKSVITGYRDGHTELAPVGSYPANALGLHDLAGNAEEWCEDWLDSARDQRVDRGAGSWSSFDRGELRSARRGGMGPHGRVSNTGFRVVLAPLESLAASPSPTLKVSPSSPVLPPFTDREAAEWVLGLGHDSCYVTVRLLKGEPVMEVRKLADLPAEPWVIQELRVNLSPTQQSKLWGKVTDAQVMRLAGLKSLKIANIRGNVTGASLKVMAQHPGMESLLFEGLNLKADDLQHLRASPLAELRFHLLQVADPDSLAVLATMPKLQHLQLLASLGPAMAAALPKLHRLEVLRTDNSASATDDVLPLLAERLPQLKVLQLWGADKLKGTTLGSLMALKSLTDLGLNNTAVTDEALTQIAGMPQLLSLELGHTRITDACLPTLKSLPKLESLTIFQTELTDAALLELASIRTLKKLVVESHVGTDLKPKVTFTAAGIAAFEKLRPDVVVVK